MIGGTPAANLGRMSGAHLVRPQLAYMCFPELSAPYKIHEVSTLFSAETISSSIGCHLQAGPACCCVCQSSTYASLCKYLLSYGGSMKGRAPSSCPGVLLLSRPRKSLPCRRDLQASRFGRREDEGNPAACIGGGHGGAVHELPAVLGPLGHGCHRSPGSAQGHTHIPIRSGPSGGPVVL